MELHRAIVRLLRPVARLLVARGVPFSEFVTWAKGAYLAAAERHFQVPGKRLTDSRLHLITGLQRKDIKILRDQVPEDAASAGPLPRLIALWMAHHSESGVPRALTRKGPAPSFEALVREVSRNFHARTALDELIRLGLATRDGEKICLTAEAFVPSGDDAALLGYFGANIGDHAAAAAENLLAAPEPGPHFERAVHYNHLTPKAQAELDALSRKLLGDALNSLSARAAALQRRDRGKPDATGRFRAGGFVYLDAAEGDDA